MRVAILGSAAGGGFPQWNCACTNCRGLRAGTFNGRARTQAQLAVSADGSSWFLLGASPDLRAQIESNADLQPSSGLRQSPIAGAVLANADIDHVLGLLLLRELQPLRVYATRSIRRILKEDNSMFGMLERVRKQVEWTDFAVDTPFVLCTPSGIDSGLRCRALSLATHFPAYVSAARQTDLDPRESSLGLIVESGSGKRLAYMPAVPEISESLLAECEAADVLLFDGTFWSDDELVRVQGSGQTARQMGHVPVEESLQRLEGVRRPRKIFVHINNTNPLLDEDGPQHRMVRDAGWEIGLDGLRMEL